LTQSGRGRDSRGALKAPGPPRWHVVVVVLFAAAATGCSGTTHGASSNENGETGASGASGRLEVTIEEVATEETDPLTEDEARLLAASVAAWRSKRHERLPRIERAGNAAADAWPSILVRNDTPYGLVVWFSGPCPRSVALAPRGSHAVEVCEGRYDIAARLASPDYLPFVGEGDEVENGSTYRLTFYVVAQPHVRTSPAIKRR